jgi:hypothetical protein
MFVSISYWGDCKSAIVEMLSVDGTPLHFAARDSSNNPAYSVIVKSSGRPNAIDPCVFYGHNADGSIAYSAEGSTLYMAYGAWSQGDTKSEDICVIHLNGWGDNLAGQSGKRTYDSAQNAEDSEKSIRICSSQPSEPSGQTGEGAFVVYKKPYYYLYIAYGVNQFNYVTRVFRSTNPEEGFEDYNGNAATDYSKNHGTQIMAPHYVRGDNYIYMSTGHDSVYQAVNNSGESILLHQAHARPVSNEANGYKELPDAAMVTRQKDLSGNITITHPLFYTKTGWTIAMPRQYNGTDTSTNIKASDLDGVYNASTLYDIIDYNLDYSSKIYHDSSYETNWDKNEKLYMSHETETTGVIYGDGSGSGLNKFLTADFTYELSYDDPVAKTTTYITISDLSGNEIAEGVVAMHDGQPELAYFNEEEIAGLSDVDTRAGATVWSVKAADLPASANFNALDAAYNEGDSLLKGLAGKTAMYSASSVEALKTALAAAKTDSTKSNAKKRLVPSSSQSTLNSEASAITDAIAALAPVGSSETVDFSTYEAAVEAVNNVDPDAYEEVKDDRAPDGHLAGAISDANVSVNATSITYETDYTINVLDGTAIQKDVDDAVQIILDALSYCTKKYAITADSGVTEIGARNGEYDDGYATYGTTMTFKASDDVAWYLEVTSRTSHKKTGFYGFGKSITVKATGALNVTTVTRDSGKKRVKFIRHYNDSTNEKAPIQFAEFVSAGSYTLPSAENTPAFAYYNFYKYIIGGVEYDPGATVTINDDTDIIAMYNYDESASYAINATALSGGANVSGSYGYNARIELQGGTNAYGWSVDLGGGKYRPFYVGANAVFFATETLNLVAEDKATFEAHGYSLPNIYLRNGGVLSVDGKISFNAQVVTDNADNIRECGILVAVANGKNPDKSATTPVVPEDYQVIVENAGQQTGYAILRAKSTKFVGANQIAISVVDLPEGYIYRGYVIYNNNGALETVYTDVVR